MTQAAPQQRAQHLQTVIFATAGHVDHGKSSLVKQLTGVDPDTLDEEKQRGLTIDLGYAYTTKHKPDGEALIVGFVDVPGHANFIHNMAAGAGATRFALFVIAADDGIMPQTKEHLAILQLLGAQAGVIALSKTDRCDAARISTVQNDIALMVKGTFLETAPVIPLSNATGEGIATLEAALLALANTSGPADEGNKQGRFLVDRRFTVKGLGTVVTGTVIDGELHAGSAVYTCESSTTAHNNINGAPIRIKSMRLHDSPIDFATQGQRAALNINVPQQQIQRGDWLFASPPPAARRRFDARVIWLAEHSIKPQAHYHLHIGADHSTATLRVLDPAYPDIVQIVSTEPLGLCHGDRFIIRDPAAMETLGGGKVLDIWVPPKKRGTPERLAWLQAQDQPAAEALVTLMRLSPMGVNLQQFASNRNLTPKAVANCLQAAEASPAGPIAFLRFEDLHLAISTGLLEDWRDKVCQSLQQHHQKEPGQLGLSAMALAKAIEYQGGHGFFFALLENLIADKLIVRTGTTLHMPGHQVTLDADKEKLFQEIASHLLAAGRVAPRTRELAMLMHVPLKKLEPLLKELSQSGHVIRVAHNRHYLPSTLIELAEFTEVLADEEHDKGGFSVIQFRDGSGIGRNLCINILEYFDRIGYTRRDGNARFLRTNKANIFTSIGEAITDVD